MAYIVVDALGQKLPDHPEDGFDTMADAMLFARSSNEPGVKVKRDDV